MPTGLEPKPKEKSPEGVRALFYAIEKSNLVYAQKVLEMNFDPNLQHDNGYTALAYAAMKGNGRMVELLLRNGADPTVTTRDGDTPVELALRLGHSEVADILKAARQRIAAGDTTRSPSRREAFPGAAAIYRISDPRLRGAAPVLYTCTPPTGRRGARGAKGYGAAPNPLQVFGKSG